MLQLLMTRGFDHTEKCCLEQKNKLLPALLLFQSLNLFGLNIRKFKGKTGQNRSISFHKGEIMTLRSSWCNISIPCSSQTTDLMRISKYILWINNEHNYQASLSLLWQRVGGSKGWLLPQHWLTAYISQSILRVPMDKRCTEACPVSGASEQEAPRCNVSRYF